MPLYDFRCEHCAHTFEHRCKYRELKDFPPACPKCTSNFTKRVWLSAPSSDRAKDPYDYLDGPIPDSKRIFSGPKVSSKTR